jgi:serine/threonine protein kinase
MKEQYGHTMERQDRFRFGNYELVRRIDVGGMGEVYLAKQRSAFDREVAIKIIREDLVHDSIARQRFLREAEVSAHLKHNHVLPMYELGEERGRLFLVTPYIAGGTLARRLQNGPLPLSDVHQLFSALLEAVAYIHRQGVVHRDLKPNNILLDEGNDGEVYVRLIDFGIARPQGASASPPLTTAGNEMGTIAYMAPERLSGVAAPSNDIYSLGVILYQMLTGQLPIDEQGRAQRLPLPQPLDDVVNRCMAPRIDERYSSAEEVLAAFERACQQMGMAKRELAIASSKDSGNGVMSLQRSVDASPAPAVAPFSPEDYNAPTTAVDSSQIAGRTATAPIKPLDKSPRRPLGRHKSIVFPIILFLAAAVLLTMSGVFAFQLLTLPTVSIHFSPQAHLVSQNFQITANPSITSIDASSKSIPIKTLNGSSTSSQSGPTSQTCNFFDNCQRVVSNDDVYSLEAQIYPNLKSQITQDTQKQLQALGAIQVDPIRYDPQPTQTINPQIGSASNTVTVRVTERWSVAYFLNKDAQALARQLLLKQMQTMGANYVPVDSTIRIGQPVVTVPDYGNVIINVAAAGYVEYRFPQSQLVYIQDNIKGKTVISARSFIAIQTGVDPKTITILFRTAGKSETPNQGDTLPGDLQRITLTTDPVSLPPVQLPSVTAGNTQSPGSLPFGTSTPEVGSDCMLLGADCYP